MGRLLSRAGGVAIALLGFAAGAGPSVAQDRCKAPEPVCAARASVYAISSAFDPYASAVRIAPDLLVTNRHAVADETQVSVALSGGEKITGDVVPTSYEGDLILIRAKLPDGPALSPGGHAAGGLYAIGQDLSRRDVRVFPKGQVLRRVEETRPYARLHHSAYTQPGVSGGALVNDKGAFVGIVTSGGAGRFEAIPVSRLAELKAKSGEGQEEKSKDIGSAYRNCIISLEDAARVRGALADDLANKIDRACGATRNRQLFDLAGQTFGRARRLDKSLSYFNRSVDMDPNAINARVGLVIALMFAQKHADALPHVRWLVDVLPKDTEVQRFAVHVGKFSGDTGLAEKGLALIRKHNPAQLEAAQRFMEAPLPPFLKRK